MVKVSQHWFYPALDLVLSTFHFPEACYLTSCARGDLQGLMSLLVKELLKEGNKVGTYLKKLLAGMSNACSVSPLSELCSLYSCR